VPVASAIDPIGVAISNDLVEGKILSYRADANQVNDVTIQLINGSWVITDAGVTTIADADGVDGCSASGDHASCPSAGLNRIRISLDDRGDKLVNQAVSLTTIDFFGGAGNDSLTGGPSGENFFAGDGDDLIRPGLGFDILDGGFGTDTVTYSERTNRMEVDLSTPAGIAIERGLLNVAVDQDFIDSSSVENVTTGSGNDAISGSGEANVIDGGPGADTMRGGGKLDTVTYSSRTNPVTASIGDGANDGEQSEGDDVQTDIENLVGGQGNDVLTGQDRVAPATDPIPLSGDAGYNELNGGPGDDVLDGGTDADVFRGGAGVDTVTYSSRTADVRGIIGVSGNGNATDDRNLLRQNDEFIGDDVENVTGGSGNDTLGGNAGPNVLDGEDGDDLIAGGDGDDSIQGGPGSDAADYSAAQTGVEVDLSLPDAQDTFGAGVDTLSSVEDVIGSPNTDFLWGNDALNILDGGDGDDYLDVEGPGPDEALCGLGDFDLATVDPDDAPSECEFLNDPAPPETMIDSGPSGLTSNRTPSFAFSSNEPGSEFECSLDSAPFDVCTSPYTAATALADGSHRFEVRAIDLVGDVDATPAVRTFTVGTAASSVPRAPIVIADTIAPTIALAIKATQNALKQHAILLQVRCPSEACTARAEGALVLPGASKQLKLAPASAKIAKGGSARLKLKLSKKSLKTVKRALKKRKRIRAHIRVTVRDSAGNATVKNKTIKVK
jgi:Ca2+-binding RTX toxin-like protein